MLIMCDESHTDDSLVRELFDLYATESAAKLDALPEVCQCNDGA